MQPHLLLYYAKILQPKSKHEMDNHHMAMDQNPVALVNSPGFSGETTLSQSKKSQPCDFPASPPAARRNTLRCWKLPTAQNWCGTIVLHRVAEQNPDA